jgi:glycosyltransferase involved in cell wall biosynthesis
MTRPPLVSIIIPTLREAGYLKETLDSLSALGSFSHELIVSDGGSTDGTLEIARAYTDKVTVYHGAARQSLGAARNAGATLASGTYLLFLDADVTLPEPRAFLEDLVADFEAHPGIVALTVPFVPTPAYGTLLDRLFIWPLNLWLILMNNVFHVGSAAGEFQMIRASAFRQLGGFREDLAAAEDNDMFYRLAKIGKTYVYMRPWAYHTCRRAHKVGWLRLYAQWLANGLSFYLFKRAASKEWTVVR